MRAQPPFRVVIVDDQDLLATALTLALRLSGLEVESLAGPSVEAVAASVRERAPALVLLDLDLGPPLGSGLDLIQPLIAAGGRVVMMTGVNERARLGACIEVGAAGIVSKDVGFDNLVDIVRRAVEGEELLDDQERTSFLRDLHEQRRAIAIGMSPSPK